MCALIKTGGGIAEIRGSIGGTTFSRGRYGAIARNRTVPVQPNSARQNMIRQNLGSIVSQWGAIVQNDRDSWNNYANATPMINRLGETVYLSGQNHFVRSSLAVAACYGAPLATAPVTFNLGDTDPTVILDISDIKAVAQSKINVVFDDDLAWANQGEGYFMLYHGQPQNVGVAYYKGPWSLYATQSGGSPLKLSSPQDIPYGYGVDFPASVGQKMWFAYRILLEDGRLTTMQTLPAQVIPAP